MATVSSLMSEKPVVIFSRSGCGMSHTIRTLIQGYGANPTVYEVDQISNGQQIERELRQQWGQPSLPTIFIGQRCTGGASQIMSLQVRNELRQKLKDAKAIYL